MQATIHQTEIQILGLQGKQKEFGFQQSNENLSLKTNTIIDFKQGMRFDTNIITQKKRFIIHIFNKLKGIFEEVYFCSLKINYWQLPYKTILFIKL